MVTEMKVRHYVESHTLAIKMMRIINFFTTFLCLLMDVIDMPSEIRKPMNQEHGKTSSGTRAFLSPPAFFAVSH
jgi:hypothetical protein